MGRRAFLGSFGAAPFLAAPGLARAQALGSVWRIGFLALTSSPDKSVEAFREQFRVLGYAEGRNLFFEFRWAAGNEVIQ